MTEDTVYENKYYRVVRSDVMHLTPVDGEDLNWEVINKQHGTKEARLSCLPSAILTADNINAAYEAIVEQDSKPSLTLVED